MGLVRSDNIFSIHVILSPWTNHTRPLHQKWLCGKIKAHKNWSMEIPEKVAPFTGIILRTIGPVPADSLQ